MNLVTVLHVHVRHIKNITEKSALSRENLSLGFVTKSGSNQSAQLQRLAKVLKLCIHVFRIPR